MVSINTFGALIDGRYKLGAFCNNPDCRHDAQLDLPALAERLGREHSTLHNDLAHKLRCSKCGGKNISLQLRPFVPGDPGYDPLK